MNALGINAAISWGVRAIHGPVAKAATTAFALRIINIFLGAVTTIILGRSLGASGFGVFSLGFACATLISGLFQAAFNTHIVRTVSSSAARTDWKTLNGVRRFSFLSVAALSTVVYAILALLLLFGSQNFSMPLFQAGLIGLATAPLLVLDATASALLRGLSRIARALVPQFVVMQGVFLISVMFLASQGILSPQVALLNFALAYLVSTTVSWIWVFACWPRNSRGKAAQMHVADWVGRCSQILLANMPNIFFGRIEVIVLAYIAGPAATGVYALAYRFAQFVTLPSFAVGSGLEPAVGKLAAYNDWPAAFARIRTATQLSTILAIALSAFLTAASWFALPYIDPTFKDATVLIGIISLGYIAQTAAGRPLLLLVLQNNEQNAALAGVASVVIGSITVFVSIAFAEQTGAAIATALAHGGNVTLLCYFLFRCCKVRSDVFASAAKS